MLTTPRTASVCTHMHTHHIVIEPQSWKGPWDHTDQLPHCKDGETEAQKGGAELGLEPRSPEPSPRLFPEDSVSLSLVHHYAPIQM